MKLGIMQPYFFPYLGYYSLINYTDKWIVFDPVQFIRHGWIERNRILKPAEGWQYIGVPLQKHERTELIRNVKIKQDDWRDKILRQIEHYRKAPFYNNTVDVIRQCFDYETESIIHLNAHILKCTCEYLEIGFNYSIFSEMDLQIDTVNDAGEWALNISKALNAQAYVNPPGGMELFSKNKFEEAGIDLQFLQVNLKPYPQRRSVFEPGLSIIDILMYNNRSAIKSMINDFKLI